MMKLVTAFTIIFVVIMSTFVKRLALYKAQSGARLSDLEQLQASISLPSTIRMIFSLRKFSKFSVTLVLAWSFYYIGSQASQREYKYVISDPFQKLSVVFPSDTGTSDFDDGNVLSAYLRAYAIDYYSSEYTSTGSDPLFIPGTDEDGYALIPDMRYTIEPFTPNNSATWHEITSLDEGYYTSYLGFPITYEYPPGSKTWFRTKLLGQYFVNTSYFEIGCESISTRPFSEYPENATRTVSLNMTDRSSTRLVNEVQKFELWTKWNSTDWSTEPLLINGSTIAISRMVCNITRPQVEVDVRCTETGCFTRRMRALPMDNATLFRTPFDEDRWASVFFDTLLRMDPSPAPDDSLPRISSIDFSLGAGKSLNAMAEANASSFTAIDDLCTPLYSAPCALSKDYDITVAFNSWYMISRSNWTDPSFGKDGLPLNTTGLKPQFSYIPTQGAPWNPHYALLWPWVITDFVTCAILLAAAIVSFWLRRHTLAPDILGYVSSLTRDNPHFALSEVGSALSGIERSRRMQSLMIKIGDVGGTGEDNGTVGRIGIGHALNENVSGLRKDLKYL
jgi:hypothetical protein